MPRERLSRLVIATHNRKKAGEMIQILSARFPKLDFPTLADYPNAPEPDETGRSYVENASIKAYSAAEATEEWCVADDAGLEVDALDGEPGLHSKRFEGEDTPFPVKMQRILERLRDVPEEKRTARFRCAVVLSPPTSDYVTRDYGPSVFEATCEGRITFEPSGSGGFGYDPIFFLPNRNCTMADLSAEEKHSVSHRGKVLKMLGDYLAANFDIS